MARAFGLSAACLALACLAASPAGAAGPQPIGISEPESPPPSRRSRSTPPATSTAVWTTASDRQPRDSLRLPAGRRPLAGIGFANRPDLDERLPRPAPGGRPCRRRGRRRRLREAFEGDSRRLPAGRILERRPRTAGLGGRLRSPSRDRRRRQSGRGLARLRQHRSLRLPPAERSLGGRHPGEHVGEGRAAAQPRSQPRGLRVRDLARGTEKHPDRSCDPGPILGPPRVGGLDNALQPHGQQRRRPGHSRRTADLDQSGRRADHVLDHCPLAVARTDARPVVFRRPRWQQRTGADPRRDRRQRRGTPGRTRPRRAQSHDLPRLDRRRLPDQDGDRNLADGGLVEPPDGEHPQAPSPASRTR